MPTDPACSLMRTLPSAAGKSADSHTAAQHAAADCAAPNMVIAEGIDPLPNCNAFTCHSHMSIKTIPFPAPYKWNVAVMSHSILINTTTPTLNTVSIQYRLNTLNTYIFYRLSVLANTNTQHRLQHRLHTLNIVSLSPSWEALLQHAMQCTQTSPHMHGAPRCARPTTHLRMHPTGTTRPSALG